MLFFWFPLIKFPVPFNAAKSETVIFTSALFNHMEDSLHLKKSYTLFLEQYPRTFTLTEIPLL